MTESQAFFEDKLTSGLDSAQAQKVVNLVMVRAWAHTIPAGVVLHQPHELIYSDMRLWPTLPSWGTRTQWRQTPLSSSSTW